MATNSTAEPTASEPDRLSAFPEWKRVVWRNISEAAENKNVFDETDYSQAWELNINLPKFEELHAWLVCCRSYPQQLLNAPFSGTDTNAHVRRLSVDPRASSSASVRHGAMSPTTVGS